MDIFVDKGQPDLKEERRIHALFLYRAGVKQKEIATLLGVTESAVSQWLKKAREGGAISLKSKEHKRKCSKITEKQKNRLIKFLTGCKIRNINLTSKNILSFIEKKFNISYNVNYIGRLIKRIGADFLK